MRLLTFSRKFPCMHGTVDNRRSFRMFERLGTRLVRSGFFLEAMQLKVWQRFYFYHSNSNPFILKHKHDTSLHYGEAALLLLLENFVLHHQIIYSTLYIYYITIVHHNSHRSRQSLRMGGGRASESEGEVDSENLAKAILFCKRIA